GLAGVVDRLPARDWRLRRVEAARPGFGAEAEGVADDFARHAARAVLGSQADAHVGGNHAYDENREPVSLEEIHGEKVRCGANEQDPGSISRRRGAADAPATNRQEWALRKAESRLPRASSRYRRSAARPWPSRES